MTIETWIALAGMSAVIALGLLGAYVMQRRQNKSKALQEAQRLGAS